MPNLALSTWSIHRALGPSYRDADDGSDRMIATNNNAGAMTLLDVPARMAEQGIKNLEICHFHFPDRGQAYMDELRAAIADAGINLYSVLIDAGDISQPDEAKRAADLEWVRSWLDAASRCGASHARIIAGEASVEDGAHGDMKDHPAIQLSAQNLRDLAAYGRNRGVQVITENFRPLTERPEAVLAIMDLCEGKIGLCVDFGNYGGPAKYDDLAAILPHATSIHAKADYAPSGAMERDDFTRCLDLSRDAGFNGPYSLIFSGDGDEWDGLKGIQTVVVDYI